jgi:hypothetical protein
MKRLLATAAAVSVLGLPIAAVSLAPAAHAITNPAANPNPITVKGDDGNTYTDGQDTLPGYDDEACTYIPGAWFDFENNRVHYADGQSIKWTEWDRATGYAEWKAKQSKPTASATAKPSSKPTAKASSRPTGKASSGGETSKGTKTSAHASSSAPAAATATPTTTATPTGSATVSATATAAPSDAATSQAPAAAAGTGADTATPASEAGSSAPTTDAQVREVAADTSGSSVSGFAIIGGLVAVAVALLGGNAVYRRSRQGSGQ